jgi:vacuolar-type H+-ATPase subunit D/Vma8
MIGSRLFELRRDRIAAQRSADLLDRKREVLMREIARRKRVRDELRKIVEDSYRAARQKLDASRVELGLEAIEAAALAQPETCSITSHVTSVMGVRILQLEPVPRPYRACYGAAETAASLDEAGAAFTALVPEIVRLAQEENAVARLQVAMRKITKLLNALRKVVLPRIEREIRATVEGIEEEERDEAARHARWRRNAGSAPGNDRAR